MRIRILASSTGSPDQAHYALSVLVNETICIDAGCLGLGDLDVQRRVKHVFLSHAHIDHTASLPIFLENVFSGTKDCVTIHASSVVHRTLQEDMFNNRTWPDFIKLSTPEAPFLRCASLEARRPVQLEGLEITPVDVDHGTETFGYLVDDGDSAFLFSADTAPTEEIWAVANECPNLKAVFLECSFPDSMAQLAEISYHMTPTRFAGEVAKLKRDVIVYPISMKARFRDQTVEELKSLGLANLEFPPINEWLEV